MTHCRQYDYLVEVLDNELGMQPSAGVQRLREEINARRAEEPTLTAELWEQVGDLRVLSGDGAGAAKAFERALDVGATSDDGARIERKCAEGWLMQHRPDEAVAHLDAADQMTTDRAERGRALRARANLAWETGEIPDGPAVRRGGPGDRASSLGTPDDRGGGAGGD